MPLSQVESTIDDLRKRILDFNAMKLTKKIPAFESMHRAFGLQNEIATLHNGLNNANADKNHIHQVADLNRLLKNQVVEDKSRADFGLEASVKVEAAVLDLPKISVKPNSQEIAESNALSTINQYMEKLKGFANQKYKGEERYQLIGAELYQTLISEQERFHAPFSSLDNKIKALSNIRRAFAETLALRINEELQKNPKQTPAEALSKRSLYTKIMNAVSSTISLKDILESYRNDGSKIFDDSIKVLQHELTVGKSQSEEKAQEAEVQPAVSRFKL